MTSSQDFGAIDIAGLRRGGSVKWTVFPDTIGAFVAEMDFGTAPVITAALHEAVDACAFGYLPDALIERMSTATAAWQQDTYGWEVPAQSIHPIPDVLKGLELVIEHFSTPGAPIIVPTPAYMPFLRVPKELNREIIEVPMAIEDGRHVLDLEGIDAAFKSGANLLILCNPYNPLGRVFDRDELIAVSAVVDRNGGRVFSDEIHAPLVYEGYHHIPYAAISELTASHTVTATSASKGFNLPGLKTAQLIITNDADAKVWEESCKSASDGASNLGVLANAVAYESGREWLDSVIAYLDGNRHFLAEILAAELPEIQYTMPAGTYIAWFDARALDLANPAAFFRQDAKVAMTDGLACGAAGAGCMRFIFATPRPIIEQAIKQMATALRSTRAAASSR